MMKLSEIIHIEVGVNTSYWIIFSSGVQYSTVDPLGSSLHSCTLTLMGTRNLFCLLPLGCRRGSSCCAGSCGSYRSAS